MTLTTTTTTTAATDDIVVYHRFTSRVQRGDIVIFHSPIDQQKMLIKRVIGLPGDTVRSLDGNMIKLPHGYCWLEGDNTKHSRDSNWYGPIRMESLRGIVTHRIYPSIGSIESTIPDGTRSRVVQLALHPTVEVVEEVKNGGGMTVNSGAGDGVSDHTVQDASSKL